MKSNMVTNATATINGYFTGDITAAVYTDKDGQHYTPSAALAATNIVLPKDASGIAVTVDGQDATNNAIGYAWDQMVAKKASGLKAFSEYLDGVETSAVTDFTEYAKRVIDVTEANTTILDLIANALATDDFATVKLSSFKNTYGDATATYTFSVNATDVVIAEVPSNTTADIVRIRGVVNKPITVAFSAEEAPEDPATLVADSFTISGTFLADTYDTTESDYINPVEFEGTFKGNFGKDATISITLDGTKVKTIALGTVTAFVLDNGSEMSATIPVGPVYVAGEDYADDKTDVVLQDGSVALSYDVDNSVWKATATATV